MTVMARGDIRTLCTGGILRVAFGVVLLGSMGTAAFAEDLAPAQAPARAEPVESQRHHSEEYYDVKTTVFNALIDTIDLSQLAQLDQESAREEIRDIVIEIVSIKNVVMSVAEQETLLEDICNDVLGYGPLEPLLARDDIADIMVNGAERVFIEVGGKVQLTNIRFRDNGQLMNICQRIVSQVGRRVDESSPICDARLPDGSRVNVIAPLAASPWSGPSPPARRSCLPGSAYTTVMCCTEPFGSFSQKQPPARGSRERFAAWPAQVWLPSHHEPILTSAA